MSAVDPSNDDNDSISGSEATTIVVERIQESLRELEALKNSVNNANQLSSSNDAVTPASASNNNENVPNDDQNASQLTPLNSKKDRGTSKKTKKGAVSPNPIETAALKDVVVSTNSVNKVTTKNKKETTRLVSIKGVAIKDLKTQHLYKFCSTVGISGVRNKDKKAVCERIVDFKVRVSLMDSIPSLVYSSHSFFLGANGAVSCNAGPSDRSKCRPYCCSRCSSQQPQVKCKQDCRHKGQSLPALQRPFST